MKARYILFLNKYKIMENLFCIELRNFLNYVKHCSKQSKRQSKLKKVEKDTEYKNKDTFQSSFFFS